MERKQHVATQKQITEGLEWQAGGLNIPGDSGEPPEVCVTMNNVTNEESDKMFVLPSQLLNSLYKTEILDLLESKYIGMKRGIFTISPLNLFGIVD